MPGVNWNLYCPHCSQSWSQKIHGPQVTCPNCRNEFSVGYRDKVSKTIDKYVKTHLEKIKNKDRVGSVDPLNVGGNQGLQPSMDLVPAPTTSLSTLLQTSNL